MLITASRKIQISSDHILDCILCIQKNIFLGINQDLLKTNGKC